MFNSIRRAIASFIAPNVANTCKGYVNATKEELSQVQTLTIPMGVGTKKRSVIQAQPADQMPMTGKFYPHHLELLSSTYLKDAIAGLGAWSALAAMSAAYAKMQQRKNANPTAYEVAKESFHVWNSTTSDDKQMGEEQVIIALDKIAEQNVPAANDQTDQVIARVLNKSIEEVRADRILKAAKATETRKAQLAALCTDVWQYSGENVDCFLSGAKVAAKGVQTLEFIATYWQGNPAAIAAELLLIEADMKIIESIARKEEEHDREGVAEVGQGNKEDYKHDPLKSQGINPNQDAIDNYMAERFAD